MDEEGKFGLDTIIKYGPRAVVWVGKKTYNWFKNIFTKQALFTPAQEARLKKIKEIIHNIEVGKSLSGEILDAGHIAKLENHKIGLQKAMQALKNSLKNPNLGTKEREIIEQSVERAEEVIKAIDDLLK